MTEYITDWFSLAGMAVSFLGAAVAAVSVMVDERGALEQGTSTWAAATEEEQLESHKVQGILTAGERARYGLWAVAGGTLLQAIPVIYRIFYGV